MNRNTSMNPNLPTVQAPVRKAGLYVNGDFVPYWELPPGAQEAYDRYAEHKNRIYQCKDCGYLTMSERTNKYKGYRCENCGGRDFRMVYGGIVPDDRIDPSDMDSDEYPNTEPHLTRIKNEVKKGLTVTEMLYEAAKAIKVNRNPLQRAVKETVDRGKNEIRQTKLRRFTGR